MRETEFEQVHDTALLWGRHRGIWLLEGTRMIRRRRDRGGECGE